MAEIMSTLPGTPADMPVLFDETGAEYVVGKYVNSQGKWKPVYKKIVIANPISTTGNWVECVALGETNKIVKFDAYTYTNSDTIKNKINYSTSTYIVTMCNSSTGDNIKNGSIAVNTNKQELANLKILFYIQYTKTTDTWQD